MLLVKVCRRIGCQDPNTWKGERKRGGKKNQPHPAVLVEVQRADELGRATAQRGRHGARAAVVQERSTAGQQQIVRDGRVQDVQQAARGSKLLGLWQLGCLLWGLQGVQGSPVACSRTGGVSRTHMREGALGSSLI